jgi:hypothetical protein
MIVTIVVFLQIHGPCLSRIRLTGGETVSPMSSIGLSTVAILQRAVSATRDDSPIFGDDLKAGFSRKLSEMVFRVGNAISAGLMQLQDHGLARTQSPDVSRQNIELGPFDIGNQLIWHLAKTLIESCQGSSGHDRIITMPATSTP